MTVNIPPDPTPHPYTVTRPAAASPAGSSGMGGIRELISLMHELIDRLEDRIEQLEHPPGKE